MQPLTRDGIRLFLSCKSSYAKQNPTPIRNHTACYMGQNPIPLWTYWLLWWTESDSTWWHIIYFDNLKQAPLGMESDSPCLAKAKALMQNRIRLQLQGVTQPLSRDGIQHHLSCKSSDAKQPLTRDAIRLILLCKSSYAKQNPTPFRNRTPSYMGQNPTPLYSHRLLQWTESDSAALLLSQATALCDQSSY